MNVENTGIKAHTGKIALAIGALTLVVGGLYLYNPCMINPKADGCPCTPPASVEANGCKYSAWKSSSDGVQGKHCHCYKY